MGYQCLLTEWYVAKLTPVQLGVQAVLGNERGVWAALDNPSILQDENLVGVLNRAETMGNHNTRAAGEELGQRPLNRCLGSSVDIARRFVQDQNPRVGQNGASKGE